MAPESADHHENRIKSEGSLRDEISFRDVFLGIISWLKFLVSQWVIIIIVACIGGVIGYLHAKKQQLFYVATSIFVLQEGGAPSAPDPLSSMLGMNSPEGGGIFQGDNLLELYRARFMVKKTLLSKIPGENDNLLQRYLEITGLGPLWKNDPKLRNVDLLATPNRANKKLLRLQDSLMRLVVDDVRFNYLNVDKDRKLSFFYVNVFSKDEEFAMLLNNQIVKTVNDFYIETKTKRTTENLKLMQHQADSIRAALNNAMYRTAASNDYTYNANPSMQVSRLPSQRSQIDAETNRTMLNELVRNIEVTKMSLRRETPLIQLIDAPEYPLPKTQDSITREVVIGALLAAIVALVYYSVLLLVRNILRPR